jgi:hypothetical protein
MSSQIRVARQRQIEQEEQRAENGGMDWGLWGGPAAMKIHLALALILLVLNTPVWGAELDRWFHVSWGPEPESNTATPRIQASVRNDSPYRVTDVQLQVEGLSADERSVGRRVVWALGDIEPGGESSFVTEAMDGAVTYRITVTSVDLVSVGSTH